MVYHICKNHRNASGNTWKLFFQNFFSLFFTEIPLISFMIKKNNDDLVM